jgi:hypothetical protein
MDREQISWVIVRAFGVYLLLQAFILLPELMAALVTASYYSSVMSSLGPGTGTTGSFNSVGTSLFRTMAVVPLLRLVLYVAVGIYMVRGGEYVVWLLTRTPNNLTDGGARGDAQQFVEHEPRERDSQET